MTPLSFYYKGNQTTQKRACNFIGLWVQLFQAQAHLKRFHHKNKYEWLNVIQLTRGMFRFR